MLHSVLLFLSSEISLLLCLWAQSVSTYFSLLCCWTLTIWNLHGTDTSRHYQPVESIKRVIDSMAFAKLVSSLSRYYYQLWVIMHISIPTLYCMHMSWTVFVTHVRFGSWAERQFGSFQIVNSQDAQQSWQIHCYVKFYFFLSPCFGYPLCRSLGPEASY
jgi:hypothetical protein